MGLTDALRQQPDRKTSSHGKPVNPRANRRSLKAHHEAASPAPPSSTHREAEHKPEGPRPAKVRTGIVSVNGRDVGVMHCQRS